MLVTFNAGLDDIIHCRANRTACASARGCGMLRDASASGMMHQPVRNQALGSLLNLAIELDWDVDAAVNEINDVDRESPEVIAAIGAVYCSGTRSPF